MKTYQQQIEEQTQLEADLVANGFVLYEGGLMKSYEKYIRKDEYSFLMVACTTGIHNQYIFIREGDYSQERHEDSLVTVFSSDRARQPLTIDKILAVYNTLIFTNEINNEKTTA